MSAALCRKCGAVLAPLLLEQGEMHYGKYARHGHAARPGMSPEYQSWRGINERCHNPKHKRYGDYGGRGITVAPEWRCSFLNFLEAVGPRPTALHTIDRIDNIGGYAPGNVRWATREEQGRNKRTYKNNSLGVKGVSRVGNRFQARISVAGKLLYLGLFKTVEEASAMRRSAENKYWTSA